MRTRNPLHNVLLAWENEALLAVEKLGKDKVEIVVPTVSILAEPPVAVVDQNVDKRGTREVATAYLEFLYTPEGQKIAAQNFYRPRDASAAPAGAFPAIQLFTIDEVFGGWSKAQPRHFDEGGVFDKLSTPSAGKGASLEHKKLQIASVARALSGPRQGVPRGGDARVDRTAVRGRPREVT